jgi:cytochrome c556
MAKAGTEMFQNVRGAVRDKTDVKVQEGSAKGLARWGAAIPGLFPRGSDVGTTRAKPAIWADKAGFDRMAMEFSAASQRLAELAAAGDAAGFAAQADVVQKSCGSCHTAYRVEEQH